MLPRRGHAARGRTRPRVRGRELGPGTQQQHRDERDHRQDVAIVERDTRDARGEVGRGVSEHDQAEKSLLPARAERQSRSRRRPGSW